MFDVEDVGKSFFPHLWSFSEYKDYVGEYPDAQYYGVDNMSPGKRDECIKWLDKMHEEKQIFNYFNEMKDYCINDVEVLRVCGEKFRKMFKENGRVDPFIDGITLSHSISLVYRKLHLKSL